jgi:hypothetical protein
MSTSIGILIRFYLHLRDSATGHLVAEKEAAIAEIQQRIVRAPRRKKSTRAMERS